MPTNPHPKRIAVLGSTGYIGGRLVPHLLDAGHEVVCVARTPARLADRPWTSSVEVATGDVLDRHTLDAAFDGVDVVYHLVHAMGHSDDFVDADRRAATNVRDAAGNAGVSHLVYLGGLGDDSDPDLSPHLRSRHEVGELLASGPTPTSELRAAIILGSGSASFEMLRSLVDVLPAMITPKWVATRCQPIAIRDVLHYLVGILDHPPDHDSGSQVLDIGGPEVLTYREMMDIYASEAGLRRRVIVKVPFLTPGLSSHWINLVTPLPIGLARPLIESQVNDVLVRPDHDVTDVIPHHPIPFRSAIGLALRRVQDLDIASTWLDAAGDSAAYPSESDPAWSGGTLLTDHQTVTSDHPPEEVFAAVERIGGRHGWHVASWAWILRGLLDKIVGGVGMRRGRLHPDRLRQGDPVDFFRVDTIDRPRLLRLRAEMKVPGAAWLEWTVEPDGSGAVLHQDARFWPRGVAGRAYWYTLLPIHRYLFEELARRIAADASPPLRNEPAPTPEESGRRTEPAPAG